MNSVNIESTGKHARQKFFVLTMSRVHSDVWVWVMLLRLAWAAQVSTVPTALFLLQCVCPYCRGLEWGTVVTYCTAYR